MMMSIHPKLGITSLIADPPEYICTRTSAEALSCVSILANQNLRTHGQDEFAFVKACSGKSKKSVVILVEKTICFQ